MKGFDVHWEHVLDFADTWEALPADVRTIVLELRTQGAFDADSFGDCLDELVSRKMLELFKEGTRARVTESFRPVLKAMRAMDRVDPFDASDPESTDDYLLEILTGDERRSLFGRGMWEARNGGDIANSRAYFQGFLDAEDPAQWEEARTALRFFGGVTGEERPLCDRQAARDVQRLLRALMERPLPVPLRELRDVVGKLPRRRLGAAIETGLRYALAFAGFDANHRPALGLAPRLALRLHRPEAKRPDAVVPEVSAEVGRVFEDVVQLLVFCSEPRRLKSGGRELFAKAKNELAALLEPVPDWTTVEFDDDARIAAAIDVAEQLGLVGVKGEDGRSLCLELTAAGRKWLARPRRERLRLLADRCRLSPDAEDDETLEVEPYWMFTSDLAAAFAFLEGPVLLDDFLRYHAESANPLTAAQLEEIGFCFGEEPTDEQLEQLWASTLDALLTQKLLPLNGVHLGMLEGQETIELTDMGRYLLRLTEELPVADEEPKGKLVVQPDFEIVFLGSDPFLEATCTRFAERIGAGVGALFRITRESVQAAVHAGMAAQEILDELARASETPIPDNVAHEIAAWGSRTVRLTWEPAQLLRCPDEETAARVLAASKGKLELVASTLLVLTNPKQRTAIAKACRKAGVFLEVGEAEEKPRRKKRTRRRRYW